MTLMVVFDYSMVYGGFSRDSGIVKERGGKHVIPEAITSLPSSPSKRGQQQ